MTTKLHGVLLTLAGAVLLAMYRIAIRLLFQRGTSETDRPAESVLNAGAMIVATIALFAAFLLLSGQPADIHPAFVTEAFLFSLINRLTIGTFSA
jgi:drug/metabolite transporter (DMT)-like permease